MTLDATSGQALVADAALAVTLVSVDPALVGGVVLRGPPGPLREALLGRLVHHGAVKLPLHVTDDRLLGGLSLADTLRAGRPVAEQGLLARAHGKVVVAAMAERLEPGVVSALCTALDRQSVTVERDGITAVMEARLGVAALDEGVDEERVAGPLRDRLAFLVDLTPVAPRTALPPGVADGQVAAARDRLAAVTVPEPIIEALCEAGEALGVVSARAGWLAVAVARVHAALAGHAMVEEEDAVVAARLVLGPRAVQLPPPPEPDPEPPPSREPAEPDGEQRDRGPDTPLEDVVLDAARSGIPAGLLDELILGKGPRSTPRAAGKSGAVRVAGRGGRPAGVRARAPAPGERLNVVETLRAAAPWQRLRPARGRAVVQVRAEDFRTTRFQERTETLVIFCVDASGSAALQRLAEAKGAAEQVLGDCYARRDQVAMIAFRGRGATLLVPPTRSLVRARRCLADLAGGGTTPLAAGLDSVYLLATEARRRGQTPVVVVMTDARANVARDGAEGAAGAEVDAVASARLLRAASIPALFLDTSPRPRDRARVLAAEMGARYLPLPYLDAAAISRHVQAL